MPEIGLLGLSRFKIISVFFVVIFTTNIHSQKYPDSTVHSLLTKGINFVIDEEFEQAEKVFLTLQQYNKSLPIADIYIAGTEIAKSFDLKLPYNEKKISFHLNRAKSTSKKMVESEPSNPWAIYFLALGEGYSAYYSAIRGSWLPAFSEGLNSFNNFERCLSMDSSFNDALIAIGSYKYWKSRKTNFLNWLPFFQDEEDYGIELLRTSIVSQTYNKHLAYNSLIWIYIDRKQFRNAISLTEIVLKEHPNSRFFKWSYARAVEEFDYEKANNIYMDILNSLDKKQEGFRINFIILQHKIAQNLIKMNKLKAAQKILKNLLSVNNLSSYEKERLGDRIERVKTHLTEVEKKIK